MTGWQSDWWRDCKSLNVLVTNSLMNWLVCFQFTDRFFFCFCNRFFTYLLIHQQPSTTLHLCHVTSLNTQLYSYYILHFFTWYSTTNMGQALAKRRSRNRSYSFSDKDKSAGNRDGAPMSGTATLPAEGGKKKGKKNRSVSSAAKFSTIKVSILYLCIYIYINWKCHISLIIPL